MQLNTAKRASFDEGSLDQYLREISQYPLITREEEVTLAEQSRIVRVPLNRAGTLHRIGKRSASLLQELGREPTVEEIAEGMDISEEEVAKTLSISQAHLSLDAPLTPGEDNKLLDYLPDTQNPGPDDEIFEHALTESIESVLATLKEREARILRLYFGLEGQEPRSEEHTSELQSRLHLVCRLLLEKKKKKT